jgi:hypothetical protein
MSLPEKPVPEPADASVARFRVVLGSATLLMVALSWPLWVDRSDFPRIPFVRNLPILPAWISWLTALLFMSSLALTTAGVAWRRMLALSLGILAILVIQDQNRLQPWIYQFALSALALVATPGPQALGLARFFNVAMYFHSGLSKWDESFARFMGPRFLSAAFLPLGIDPAAWNYLAREIAVRLMPGAEIAVALGLCFRRTRTIALVGAVLIHATLIWILSPFGLDQSAIVLVWNGALIAENIVLFRRVVPEAAEKTSSAPWVSFTRLVFMIIAILPFAERRGLFDAWPSFAYYASHVEQTRVWTFGDDSGLPPEARKLLDRMGPKEVPRGLRLTDWSRAVRGVPIYPQARVAIGMAEWLATRCPGLSVRVTHLSSADRRGSRSQVELIGLESIRNYGERYVINAHPAGISRRRTGVALGR